MRRVGHAVCHILVAAALGACDERPARVVPIEPGARADASGARSDAPPAPADEAEARALSSGRAVPCPDAVDIGFVGPWYSFSDANLAEIEGRCAPCASPVNLARASGAPGSAWCPVTMTGRMDEQCDSPFAGMGVRFDMVDRRDMGALVLSTQGDGRRYRLDFIDLYQEARLDGSCDDEDGNHPGTFFTCGDGSGGWREVRIPLDGLAQRPGWGVPHDLQLRDLRKMNVVFDGYGDRDPSEEGAAPRDMDFRCSVAVLRWEPRAPAAPPPSEVGQAEAPADAEVAPAGAL